MRTEPGPGLAVADLSRPPQSAQTSTGRRLDRGLRLPVGRQLSFGRAAVPKSITAHCESFSPPGVFGAKTKGSPKNKVDNWQVGSVESRHGLGRSRCGTVRCDLTAPE